MNRNIPQELLEILAELREAITHLEETVSCTKAIFLQYVEVGHKLGYTNEMLDWFLCDYLKNVVHRNTLLKYRKQLKEEEESSIENAHDVQNDYNILLERIVTFF
jgi:hypothetical protein